MDTFHKFWMKSGFAGLWRVFFFKKYSKLLNICQVSGTFHLVPHFFSLAMKELQLSCENLLRFAWETKTATEMFKKAGVIEKKVNFIVPLEFDFAGDLYGPNLYSAIFFNPKFWKTLWIILLKPKLVGLIKLWFYFFRPFFIIFFLGDERKKI